MRSDEVQDILGKVPAWVTRNGILVLFFLVVVLLAGAWIIRVPDIKKAEVWLTSVHPPAEIEARMDGKIEALMVADNGEVDEGQVLAVIENPADYNDVLGLKDQLRSFTVNPKMLPEIAIPVNGEANLGMIQPDFASFLKSYRDYRDFVELAYHSRKITLLREEYSRYRRYSENLDTRAGILREEYALADKQFRRDSVLFLQGVVSEADYESSRAKMLGSRAGWQEMISLKAENDIQMAGIEKQILEMELKEQEQRTTLATSVEEALNRLKGSIATWEKQYLIVSPVAGQVTFNRIWSENQNVRTGEKVVTVIPADAGELVGKIRLPLTGAGEVKSGNQVNIRLENYPYLEYGMIRGEVSNVSKIPQDNFYTVEVTLPDGLKTYYGLEIGFRQNLHGQAEILTDRMRLLQRIFNPVRSALTRQREMKVPAS